MTDSHHGPTAGDVLQAYQQLDETGRRVFSCAFLHIWAAQAARFRAQSAGIAGGHWRDWSSEVLTLPQGTSFGRGLEVPMPGIFDTPSRLPKAYQRIC